MRIRSAPSMGATPAARLRSFAAAAARVLGPHGISAPSVRLLPPSEGARNHLLRCATEYGPAMLKVAADPALPPFRELFGLRALPAGVGPRLRAHATSHVLRERAAQRKDWDTLRQLDLPLGHCLLMDHVDGRHPSWPLSDDAVVAAGRAVARLHCPVKDGPPIATGSHPEALMRTTQDAAEELRQLGGVDATTTKLISSGLKALRQHLDGRWRSGEAPRVRTLCHGDLRWHNMVRDGLDFRFVDLEHAGVGDPAVDLALMACRTPLNLHEELCILDGYLSERKDPTFLDRYFTVKPVLGMLGALEAVLDLTDIARGVRRATVDAQAQVARRVPLAAEELRHALERVIPEGRIKKPVVRIKVSGRREQRAYQGTVAIDGTALSGKSLVASELARRLGIPHFNTGMLYRHVALWALQRGLRPTRRDDVDQALGYLRRMRARLLPDGSLEVNGQHQGPSLTVLPVDAVVASWARLPSIRQAVQPWFDDIRGTSSVLEGRDIGTVVCPDARFKLYVDASLEERTRRLLERCRGMVTPARATRLITARDQMDMERAVAPLVPARGARRVDATGPTPEQLADRILHRMRDA